MSNTPNPNPDRIDQLMVDAATQGLSPQDEVELSAAIAQDAALRAEAEAYELAATAIDLAMARPAADEALPAALRDRLIADAPQHLPGAAKRDAASTQLKLANAPASSATPQRDTWSWTDGRAFGWYAAIAATLALCLVLLQSNQPGSTTTPTPTGSGSASAAPLDEQYQALASRPDTLTAQWTPHPDGNTQAFGEARGEVIWNNDTQTGYMKLNGMPINDPTEIQYQLWIVDADRADETTDRIDGGVFNVTDSGEVIVPIQAKIKARDPKVFAITVEEPGGVVVSKGPLQVVAAVGQDG